MEMNDDKFTALYAFDTFGQLILRTAYCCVGNYSEAEDISQEVFLKLHENPEASMMTSILKRGCFAQL